MTQRITCWQTRAAPRITSRCHSLLCSSGDETMSDCQSFVLMTRGAAGSLKWDFQKHRVGCNDDLDHWDPKKSPQLLECGVQGHRNKSGETQRLCVLSAHLIDRRLETEEVPSSTPPTDLRLFLLPFRFSWRLFYLFIFLWFFICYTVFSRK